MENAFINQHHIKEAEEYTRRKTNFEIQKNIGNFGQKLSSNMAESIKDNLKFLVS